jgi:hypothetical protein
VILTGTPGTRSQFRLPIADSAVIGLLSATSIIGCLSSGISGIASSQRLGMQSSAKRRGLFVDRTFVYARNSVFRHGANSRANGRGSDVKCGGSGLASMFSLLLQCPRPISMAAVSPANCP